MRILNHELRVSFNARREWDDLQLFTSRQDGYIYRHLVWGRLSIVFGQPHLFTQEYHKACGGDVQGLGEDGISYCESCECICEGSTESLTEDEHTRKYG